MAGRVQNGERRVAESGIGRIALLKRYVKRRKFCLLGLRAYKLRAVALFELSRPGDMIAVMMRQEYMAQAYIARLQRGYNRSGFARIDDTGIAVLRFQQVGCLSGWG